MNDTLAAGMTAWLLTYAIHSTVLLGMAWLVLRVRRAGPDVADLLWKVALMGGIITATSQSLIGVQPTGSLALREAPALATADPNAIGPTEGVEIPAPASGDPAAVERNSPVPAAGSPAAPAEGTAAAKWSTSGIVAATWAVLALLFLAWHGGRRLILVGRLGDRRVLVDGELPAVLAALRQEAGVRRPIRLTASNAISSPVALGRSEICLPVAALDELEPAQQRAMLAHELAHLVRRDPQWLAVACGVERLFFFQPLNRLARRGIQESAEYQADAWAARRTGGVPLARCLVKVAEWIEASPLGVPVAGMAEQRSQLSVRVARLLEGGTHGAPRRQPLAAMLSLGVLVATTALAPGVISHRGQPQEPFTIPTDRELGVDGSELDYTGTTSTAASRTEQGDAPHDANRSRNSNSNSESDSERTGLVDSEQDVRHADVARDTVVVRALMQRLKDEDAEVRQAAAHALGQIENPMAIPALVEALGDPDRDVQEAALDALSSFDRGVPAAPIRRMLAAEDPEMRQRAIHILAEIKDRESLPAIARLVGDADAEVRQQAIWALSEIGDPASAPAVAAGLADRDPEVRQAALWAMRELGGAVEPATLMRLLQDDIAEVRQAAIEYAAERQVASAVPLLVRLLDDPSGEVRECAAEALTEIRTTESHAALRRALDHADAKVRRVAVEYFGEEGDS